MNMSAQRRKVVVYEYTNKFGDPLVKGELGTGIFHQFGYDCMEDDRGFSSYSTAIVEMPDGSVITPAANMIKFINDESESGNGTNTE